MRYKSGALAVIFLLIITLVTIPGCGPSKSESELTDLQSQNASLSLKLDNLYRQYQSLQTSNSELSSKYAALQDENTSLKSENSNTTAELNSAQSESTVAAKKITTLQDALSELQNKYDSLQNDYQSANNELSGIKAIYPPRNFTSKDELTGWLTAKNITAYDNNDPVAVYEHACELRQLAADDGYILNVNVGYYGASTMYFRIYCTAQVQNTLYYWDVQTGGLDTVIPDVTDFKWATAY